MKAGYVEYKMPIEMAKNYINSVKGIKTKDVNSLKAQQYLVKVVNEEFGLLGECTRVILY